MSEEIPPLDAPEPNSSGVFYESKPPYVVMAGQVSMSITSDGEVSTVHGVRWEFESAHFDWLDAVARVDWLSTERQRARIVTREAAGI